jgi:hypothetical protein
MVSVAVRDEHSFEAGAVLRQRFCEICEMPGLADSRVNQHGTAIGSDEDISVVAEAGHRTRVVGREQDGRQHA